MKDTIKLIAKIDPFLSSQARKELIDNFQIADECIGTIMGIIA